MRFGSVGVAAAHVVRRVLHAARHVARVRVGGEHRLCLADVLCRHTERCQLGGKHGRRHERLPYTRGRVERFKGWSGGGGERALAGARAVCGPSGRVSIQRDRG
eukprot:5965070-Prymnesium_polylepis.1